MKGLPPGSRAPAIAQAVSYARDPLGFLARHQRRYGDVFTVRFPFFGHIVYVARPDLVKAVFTGSPSVTVLAAGHETTATGLAWAVERLVRNPAVLARLRDSIAAGSDEYLGATVKETLRARPVIVDVARKLKAPARIGEWDLPAGTFVLPAIAALHYREDLFPAPDEFRPERFLDGKADNYAWIPFGGGVRRCIGAAFAEYEMRLILREFVERAELRPVEEKPERVKVRNITLTPAKGARVIQASAAA
ncbi:MAG TPA: cytochrome P450 [Solirubrobacterales bacterium]|nr:cytochrome P450 [Solirubrobacterales bacterium]